MKAENIITVIFLTFALIFLATGFFALGVGFAALSTLVKFLDRVCEE